MNHIGTCRVARNWPLSMFKAKIDHLELELWCFEVKNDKVCLPALPTHANNATCIFSRKHLSRHPRWRDESLRSIGHMVMVLTHGDMTQTNPGTPRSVFENLHFQAGISARQFRSLPAAPEILSILFQELGVCTLDRNKRQDPLTTRRCVHCSSIKTRWSFLTNHGHE